MWIFIDEHCSNEQYFQESIFCFETCFQNIVLFEFNCNIFANIMILKKKQNFLRYLCKFYLINRDNFFLFKKKVYIKRTQHSKRWPMDFRTILNHFEQFLNNLCLLIYVHYIIKCIKLNYDQFIFIVQWLNLFLNFQYSYQKVLWNIFRTVTCNNKKRCFSTTKVFPHFWKMNINITMLNIVMSPKKKTPIYQRIQSPFWIFIRLNLRFLIFNISNSVKL